MKGWMLSWKNPDPERMFSRTYINQETAYRHAAESIRRWAQEELVDLRDDPTSGAQVEVLEQVLSLIDQGENNAAYEEWRAYADDAEPREDVMIEDTEIVEE